MAADGEQGVSYQRAVGFGIVGSVAREAAPSPVHVLLLVNEEAHIREMARLAVLLLRQTGLRPVIYMEDRLKHLGCPEMFVDLGLEMLCANDFPDDSGGAAALGRPGWSFRQGVASALTCATRLLMKCLPARLQRYLKFKYLIDLGNVDLHRDIMLKRAARANAALAQRDYRAIVMSEDNVELDTAVWIAVARRRGVRSMILPYTISNTAEFAESYVHHGPLQVSASWQNRTVAALFPRWALRYKGRRLLRTDYAKIVAVELLGLAPPNPWLLNSGSIDAIAVESSAMRQYYRQAGIPETQLVVSGSLTDDVISLVLQERGARRAALGRSFGFADDRPLLLAALPPDQNTYDRPGCEFVDFSDLIDFWGATLAVIPGWNVVVRPHPKTRPETLEALRRHGVAISYRDTAELVPLCDLYVASVSATIRWAIACAKPVVNYDVYRYDYRDYEAVPGVTLVTTRSGFVDALRRLTGDASALAQQALLQSREASNWAVLDGQSGRRMIALIGADAAPDSTGPARDVAAPGFGIVALRN